MRGVSAGMLPHVSAARPRVHHRFVARIEAAGGRGSCAVSIPADVDAALGGGRGRIALVGTADGRPFRTAAAPTGGGDGRMFLFSKEMQIATGHAPGEEVEFEIARERTTTKDDGQDALHEALRKNARARDVFAGLPPARKREYLAWIAEARRDDMRAKRIEETVRRLAGGAEPLAPKGKEAAAKKVPARTTRRRAPKKAAAKPARSSARR
jgi:hypothetical protein